jgi:uncharacterized membrane protein YeaQ/YmgE (transglycosylase-associated protein family)
MCTSPKIRWCSQNRPAHLGTEDEVVKKVSAEQSDQKFQSQAMKIQNMCRVVLITWIAVLLFHLGVSHAADDRRAGGERLGAASDQAQAHIEAAGTAAATKLDQIWQRIDERRLANRTRDEIVAWILMGLLVGSIAGLLSVSRKSALHRYGAAILGLVGAFAGGMLAHVAQLDFGLGPVLIRYEDLLLSLAGGLFLILLAWLFKPPLLG